MTPVIAVCFVFHPPSLFGALFGKLDESDLWRIGKPVVWCCLVTGSISAWWEGGSFENLWEGGALGLLLGVRLSLEGIKGGEGWGVARIQDLNSQPGQPL